MDNDQNKVGTDTKPINLVSQIDSQLKTLFGENDLSLSTTNRHRLWLLTIYLQLNAEGYFLTFIIKKYIIGNGTLLRITPRCKGLYL